MRLEENRYRSGPPLFALALSISLSVVACNGDRKADACEQSPGELYEQRVVPLLQSDTPSSCARCHAGGLDLDDLLREDACESMACLLAEGLVDLDHPERSVLLSFILRSEPESELITDEVVRLEYEAFLSWIEHEATCRECEGSTCSGREGTSCETDDPLDTAFTMETDPGDCDRATLERLFRGTAYAERGRCSPCHFEEETTAAPNAPRWMTRTGTCQVAALATLQNIEASGYIDVEDPENSLLLLKPLAEVQGGLSHGGHDKFVKGNDAAYDNFLYFVSRYGACATETTWVRPDNIGGSVGK